MARTNTLEGTQEQNRIGKWRREITDQGIVPEENMAEGFDLPYVIWRTLNRLRVGVSKCKTNMLKWGLLMDNNTLCECGEIQNSAHLLTC